MSYSAHIFHAKSIKITRVPFNPDPRIFFVPVLGSKPFVWGRRWYNVFQRASERSSERVSERASDRSSERANERASDRARKRAIERESDRSSERAIERASDRASDRAMERASDRATERPSDRATEDDHNSSSRRPFETLTNAFCIIFSKLSVLEQSRCSNPSKQTSF